MRPGWSLRDLFNFLSSFDRFLSPFFNQPSHHLSPPQFLSQNLLWRLCIFLVSFNLGQVNLVVTLKCTYLFTSSQSVCLLGPTFILVLAGRPHKRNCTFWYRWIWGSPTTNFFCDCRAIWNVIAKSSVCKMLILHACIQFRFDLLERNNNFLCSLCDIVASVWMNLKQIENLITSRVGFIV